MQPIRTASELAAHIVIPVPDTGTPAAIGFAQASRIPYGEGMIKNRYVHRTFIEPDQRMRDLGVKMKFAPLKETLAGKRIVMVEDSIVRGTTTCANWIGSLAGSMYPPTPATPKVKC